MQDCIYHKIEIIYLIKLIEKKANINDDAPEQNRLGRLFDEGTLLMIAQP
jgi:hypothetical protein